MNQKWRRFLGFVCAAALGSLVGAGLAAAGPVGTGASSPAAGGSEPRIESVHPGRSGDLLTCQVHAANLPGPRILSSLRSGLPSGIELVLELLDAEEHSIAGNRVSFRIAFDLWEEVFRVEGLGEEQRFADEDAFAAYLASPPRLPVAPVKLLEPDERFRIRVDLLLHPVAPEETDRLGEWVGGGAGEADGGATGSSDGREVLVDLGQVIRFFYRGSRRSRTLGTEGLSHWFTLADLKNEGDLGAASRATQRAAEGRHATP
jgi:hypothetical protein